MTFKPILCVAILTLALIFKFWLIAEMEITDDDDDPSNYVQQILLHRGLCYGPGTGDVGRLFYDLHIPFRIGIEAAFLVSAFVTVAALLGSPVNSYLALGVCLFVSYDPAVEELLSHFLSDQIWMVETLLGFSWLVFFARTSARMRWAWVALAAVALGFTTITRSTFIPQMAIFAIWAVLAGGLAWGKDRRRSIPVPAISGCFLCVYASAFFYYSTCYHNAEANGFHGLSSIDCREYQDFYMCLQSVGDPTGPPFYPVDNDRLKLIASAGPRSRWFVDQLGRETSFHHISQEVYGKPGVALCWFHWAVIVTFEPYGAYEKAFVLFKEIEDEIAQAAREKRLKVRRIIPLPDCRVAIVLSVAPDCFGHIAALVTAEPAYYAWASTAGRPRFEEARFSIALRRQQVSPSLLREQIGAGFCAVYARVYAPLLVGLALAVVLFILALIYRWRRIAGFSFCFLAQQIFLVAFVIYFLWYLLFDASGLLAVPRYLVFNHVMLPILLIYYARQAGWLFAGKGFEL